MMRTRAGSASDRKACKPRVEDQPVARAPGSCFLAMLPVLLFAALTGSACNQREPAHIEDPEDEIPPKEAQSDFIDIGKQAGIDWLSFVPNAEREYPSLYQGLDRDQKRRLWLAPMETPSERVLLHFELPAGSKIWPVQWYGTDLLAVDLPNAHRFSVALAKTTDASKALADIGIRKDEALKRQTEGKWQGGSLSPSSVEDTDVFSGTLIAWGSAPSAQRPAAYAARQLNSADGGFTVLAEVLAETEGHSVSAAQIDGLVTILSGVSVARQLAIEGLPTHKCASSIADLRSGIIRLPGGRLSVPLSEEQLARKAGGDSTVQIDGHGAKPWVLIRRLSETSAPGDLRVRVRGDPTFRRRLDNPGASFSAGYAPEASIPGVFWDYRDAGTEQVTVGILKVGNELLTFEIISTGLRDAESRRKARQAALDLLAGATAEPSNEAPEFQPLIGWNVGTMGRDD